MAIIDIMKKHKILWMACAVVASSCIGYTCFSVIQNIKKERLLLEQRRSAWAAFEERLRREINNFNGETAVIVKDLATNWEFDYNRDILFPSASLAKIPIMSACYLAAEQGLLRLDSQVRLRNADKISGSGILKNTRPGTAFTFEELIGLMIYRSDNTATNILTNTLGLDYLSRSFISFGLKNSNLSRRVADFRARDSGIENYTTAADMASLLERIYRKDLVNKDVSEKCLKIMSLQHIKDRIPRYLPEGVNVAHKTGLERGVCHDVGILFSGKGNLLICVLTRHSNQTSAPAKKFIGRAALLAYDYLDEL